MTTDRRLLLLSPGDSVYVLRGALEVGETVLLDGRSVRIDRRLGLGHKLARRAHAPGDKVIKYGAPIGSAIAPIAPGDHVHLHNLRSDYTPTYALGGPEASL
jgi:hypothetical protein